MTRSKPLSPTDPMEKYVERIEEMAAEMEDALEYMHSVQQMIKEAEDIQIMQEMDKTV